MKLFITAKIKAKNTYVEELDPLHFIVHVKEPPHQGKANAAIIKLLARHLGVPQWRIEIVKGMRGKEKVVEVQE